MAKNKKPRKKKYHPLKHERRLENQSIGQNHIVDLFMKTNPVKLTENDRTLLILPMKMALEDLQNQKATPEAHLTFAERSHWLWCIYDHFKREYKFGSNVTEDQAMIFRLEWDINQEFIMNDMVKVLENLRKRTPKNPYGLYVTMDEVPVFKKLIDMWDEVIDYLDAGVIYAACIQHRKLLVKDANKTTIWDPFRVHYQTVNKDGSEPNYHYTSENSEKIVNHITTQTLKDAQSVSLGS